MSRDLLRHELTSQEAEIIDVYERLKALCRQELPPVAEANLRAALVSVYNVVNSLALKHEHLIELGV